jgi:hypothetical protein
LFVRGLTIKKLQVMGTYVAVFPCFVHDLEEHEKCVTGSAKLHTNGMLTCASEGGGDAAAGGKEGFL